MSHMPCQFEIVTLGIEILTTKVTRTLATESSKNSIGSCVQNCMNLEIGPLLGAYILLPTGAKTSES